MNKICYIRTDNYKSLDEEYLYNILPLSFKSHIDKYKNDRRKESLLAYSILYSEINKLNPVLTCNEYGKPYINGIYFSISHTDGLITVLISDSNCGIDTELKMRKYNKGLMDKCLLKEEKNNIRKEEDFMKFWCIKEAYSKYTGKGINESFKTIHINDKYEIENADVMVHFHDIDNNYIVTSVTMDDIFIYQEYNLSMFKPKTLEVVSAFILNDKGQVFISRRGKGLQEGKFEFPGGKTELFESKEDAIIREIKEEFDTDIEVMDYIGSVHHDYTLKNDQDEFSLNLSLYLCKIVKGEMKLLEHTEKKYVDIKELDKCNLSKADEDLIPYINTYFKKMK